MTSSRPARTVAAALALGLTAALLAALTVAPPARAGSHPATDRKHKGKVVWGPTTYQAGLGQVSASGKVPGGKRKVSLQVKVPGSWRTFAKTRSNRHGKFGIAGRLDWYGEHKVRVHTRGRHPFNRSTTVRVFAQYAPRGNVADHAFPSGEHGYRYSFNPCRTVRYAVNADDVSPFGITLVQMGMAQVSAATGIQVKYVGTSHQIAFLGDRTRLPKGVDLLVGWADEQEQPKFVTETAIGLGGPVQVARARDGAGRPVLMTRQAAVVLDTTAYWSGNYTAGYFGSEPTWGEVILHELGHAFGLQHVAATDEIMYPAAGNGPYPGGTFAGLYDAGDLTGLATNGLSQGCFHQVRSFRVGDRGGPVAVPAPQP